MSVFSKGYQRSFHLGNLPLQSANYDSYSQYRTHYELEECQLPTYFRSYLLSCFAGGILFREDVPNFYADLFSRTSLHRECRKKKKKKKKKKTIDRCREDFANGLYVLRIYNICTFGYYLY